MSSQSSSRKISRRALIQATAGAAVALILAACAPAATPVPAPQPTAAGGQPTPVQATAAPKPTPPPATAPKPVQPVTIEFWHNKQGVEGDAIKAIVDKWNAAHPEVQVKQTFQGSGSDLLKKVMASVTAGSPPDIIYGYGIWMTEFASSGILAPVEEMMKSAGVNKADYYANFIDYLTYQGKLQGLPYGTGTKVFYYRSDIFKDAGITTFPKTWAEFEAAAKSIAKSNCMALGFDAQDHNWFKLLLWQKGGNVLNADNTKAAVNSAEGIAALQQMKDMVTNGVARVSKDVDAEFRAGTIAAKMSGEYEYKMLATDKIPFAVAYFPTQKDGDKHITLLGGDAFYIFKSKPEREQAAFKFAVWMTSPEPYFEWGVKGSYRQPISPKIAELKAYQDFVAANPGQEIVAAQVPNAVMNPKVKAMSAIDTAIKQAVERVLVGGADPKQSLDQAAQEIEKALAG